MYLHFVFSVILHTPHLFQKYHTYDYIFRCQITSLPTKPSWFQCNGEDKKSIACHESNPGPLTHSVVTNID